MIWDWGFQKPSLSYSTVLFFFKFVEPVSKNWQSPLASPLLFLPLLAPHQFVFYYAQRCFHLRILAGYWKILPRVSLCFSVCIFPCGVWLAQSWDLRGSATEKAFQKPVCTSFSSWAGGKVSRKGFAVLSRGCLSLCWSSQPWRHKPDTFIMDAWHIGNCWQVQC